MKKKKEPSQKRRTALHYAGQPGEGFGWGVCNANLKRELGHHFDVADGEAEIVFMPLCDHDLNPATTARGKVNVAYTFFEYDLGPNAAANAAKYDIVFCGSTWCKERLAEIDVHNTEVLIQGVDQSIFYTRPRVPDGQFRIFSGGKFEYRKGQDLVIAAFREFAKAHPEAHLVCSWFNPWPQIIRDSLCLMKGIETRVGASTQEDFFTQLLLANGIPREQFTVLPPLRHSDLAEQMAQTDCGLFPNRCEGGTNLVLMEYAACGRHIAANTVTGHADVHDLVTADIVSGVDRQNWADQQLSDIVTSLRACHLFKPIEKPAGIIPTWQQSAQTVANAIERLALVV